MLFDHVTGLVGTDDGVGVFCCGLQVMSVDGSSTATAFPSRRGQAVTARLIVRRVAVFSDSPPPTP
jgi:hypothetical protein